MKELKNRVDEAYKLGKEAFIAGEPRAPALIPDCIALIYNDDSNSIDILRAFLIGWDWANINS